MATDAHCTPIRWLFKYMIGRFENTNDSFLDLCENLIAENKIKPGIQIDDTLNAHITPDGVIILGERLMCYLWCMCYFGLVSYEKAIAVYHENMINGTNEDIDYEDVEIAEKCRRYAMSLKPGLVDWPDELPKPEEHDGNESINMTNQVFLYAMNFIMCHELAHRELGHKGGLRGEKSINQEYAADERSFELMLQGRNGKNDLTIELGILIGFCAILMLSSNEKDGLTHPSSINRLEAFLKKIDPESESQLWGVACLYLGVWDSIFRKDFDFPEVVTTHKEMFYKVIGQIR